MRMRLQRCSSWMENTRTPLPGFYMSLLQGLSTKSLQLVVYGACEELVCGPIHGAVTNVSVYTCLNEAILHVLCLIYIAFWCHLVLMAG